MPACANKTPSMYAFTRTKLFSIKNKIYTIICELIFRNRVLTLKVRPVNVKVTLNKFLNITYL